MQQATGVTIIAIGTSLPDTIASRTAALQDSTADAAIGNVTGSNRYLYLVAYLSSYHEKAIKSLLRARLGVAGHLSATIRWGNSAKCLFLPKSKLAGLFSTLFLMRNVKLGRCNTNFKGIGLTRSKSNPILQLQRRTLLSLGHLSCLKIIR